MILYVFIILGAGFALGVYLRGRERALRVTDHLMNASIYFFLFVLGLMVGADRETLNRLHQIGFESVLIALAAVMGSLVAAAALSRFFLKDGDIEE